MSYISSALTFLINTLKRSANPLVRDFTEIEQLQSSQRGLKEYAGAALAKVTTTLRNELNKGRPDYAVVFDNEPRPNANHFLVSAIEGYNNFMHGVPYFAVSIAIVENGVITASAIYNPATSDMFFAEKGSGAFKEGNRNHERLRVSSRKELGDSLIGLTDAALAPEVAEAGLIRVMGSVCLDMAAVAAGHFDGEISSNNSAAAVAAGALLVKEGGGYVFELNQKDIRTDDLASVMASGNLIAVNAELGKKLHQIFNK